MTTGLPEVRLYDLRHTSATLLLLAGVHVKIVSERLGHADVSLTLNTYSHVLPDMQRDATMAIAGALHGIVISGFSGYSAPARHDGKIECGFREICCGSTNRSRAM